MANWKPVTYEQFVDDLCTASMTFDEPDKLTIQAECLDDGRMRLVVQAAVCTRAPGERGVEDEGREQGPYLMLLHQPEGGKTHAFIRTTVELCMG